MEIVHDELNKIIVEEMPAIEAVEEAKVVNLGVIKATANSLNTFADDTDDDMAAVTTPLIRRFGVST